MPNMIPTPDCLNDAIKNNHPIRALAWAIYQAGTHIRAEESNYLVSGIQDALNLYGADGGASARIFLYFGRAGIDISLRWMLTPQHAFRTLHGEVKVSWSSGGGFEEAANIAAACEQARILQAALTASIAECMLAATKALAAGGA